jgi:hypothetical protein
LVGPYTERGQNAQRWSLRVAVLSTFIVVVWLFGPRAANVLAARFQVAGRDSPPVFIDRVGFVETPAWLQGPMLLAVVRDLEPCLRGSVPILDEATATALQSELEVLPWVAAARLQRVFPDRLRLHLELREPVLEVRDGEQLLCCVDRNGIALPPVDADLPATVLRSEGGRVPHAFTSGAAFPDPRAIAAAQVAVEWREQVAPLVPGCPALIEVDANNLGERWLLGPRHPEIRVVLRSAQGTPVVFAYDRPVNASLPRVPHATKAVVLRAILQEHQGLQGLTGGDLRLPVRWRDWLLPRPGPDPSGPFPDPEAATISPK